MEFLGVLHQARQSSFLITVNEMWKLCNGWGNWQMRKSCCEVSAKFGTDFSHEGTIPNAVTMGRLRKFSTSPTGLLLLLVL